MSAPTNAIESNLVENRVFPPSDAVVKAARISGMAAYDALCNEANTDFALVVSGFMGRAIAFLFGQESATRAVRSYQNGLNTSVAPPEAGPG